MKSEETRSTKDLVTLNATQVARAPWQPFRGLPDVEVRELWRTGEGVAGLLRFANGAHEVPHEHHLGHHHLWLLEGKARIGNRSFGAGSYVHVPAGIRHDISAEGPAGCTFFFVYSRSSTRP